MALGILMRLNVILIIIAVIIQGLLYKGKSEFGKRILIINMVFSMFLSYVAFTSLPINFTGQRVLAIIFGVIPLLAVVLRLNTEKYIIASKVMISISILGTFLQLFL